MFAKNVRTTLNPRSSRGILDGSWLLPVSLIVLSLVTRISCTSVECCPKNTTWIGPAPNCSDGSNIRINCNNGYYRLDPEINHFDEFEVIFDGEPRLEFLHGFEPIMADSFCLSGKDSKERWALVCFDDEDYTPARWKHGFFGFISLISFVFLVLTLIVYALLPELRDIQDKAMISAISFLASSYFLLAIEQMGFSGSTDDVICVSLAFLLYWSFLSAFFWLNLVAFNIWRSVWFKSCPIKDKDLFIIYCAIAITGPGIFLLVALGTHHTAGHHLKPHFGETNCWFAGNSETWAFFYGPISFLLVLNVIYLALTCWRLWFEYRGYNGNGLKALRFNCLLYVKLIFVMGIPWIFEIISFAASPRQNEMYWFATDILNGLQGVLIFVLLVATRKRVKKLLARRKPFGLTLPKSWAAYNEEDEIAPALAMDVEL